ncbi:PD-(D/E)XK nuclease family protein [Pleurocapsa sp. PCC 7319]|uniref:PD-(D/E)XK nuclease family protein n=1 Tax=Pleurocapsa sp. PCC 7319 TaxID=118161 RepID=UPI000347000E|nr:PD-(D/E)XK nuclease family protein [Pleurocapsa sp. PCC 7319]
MGRYIATELSSLVSLNSNIQVITPSKPIASSLKVPHYSLESLAQNIVRRQGFGIASTLFSRRLLQNAVQQTIDTQDVAGTAKAFLVTIKDLFRGGVDLRVLQKCSDPRIRQLGNLAIAYRQQLRKTKRIDAAEIYWQGAVDVTYQKAYLFYGYFAPGKDELALIDAIAGDNSILVLPQDELFPQNQKALGWLQSQGWKLLESHSNQVKSISQQLQKCFKQSAALPTGAKLNPFPNLEAEVRGVLTQVKVLLTQGVLPPDIVLITREEQLYGETLIDIAWEYNLPVQVSYEIPLEQTRIGAWLKLLLEVIRDQCPFEATAKLLSHPLAKCMSPEIWSEARQQHPQGIVAWQKLGIDLSLLNLSQNSYRRDIWLKRLQDILTSWDVLEKAKYWAREIVAFYRLQEALLELFKPGEQQLSKAGFLTEINEILALLTVPAQPGRGGIELHTPTSLLGTKYPYVFVLGSAEGILPAAIADDSILDFHSRKQLTNQGLDIETAIDIAQRETFNFYSLLDIPTQNITFSYPELIDRQPTFPSPYLTRLGLQPTTVNTLPLASIELTRQAYLRQPNLLDRQISSTLLIPSITTAWQVEARRGSAIAPDEYDGVIGIKIDPLRKIFSASQLTQLGQCPFKWYSARLLKLKELTEAESDLSAAFRGNLYHRTLELSLEQIKTASDLAKFNQEQLAQAFKTAEQELNLTQLPGWEAQRQEHLDLLALNLASTEFLPPERQVLARETKFDTQWYGLKVQGQVDRIDRTETGLTVIDYKTSGVTPAGVKDATGKANIDIQLAVYQDAIAEQYPDKSIEAAAYYSVTKQKTISRPQKDPQKLAAFAEKVKSYLEQGHYPVAPDIDRKACRYCDYDLVCRQGDRLSRQSH